MSGAGFEPFPIRESCPPGQLSGVFTENACAPPQAGTGRARCPACSSFSPLLPGDPYLTHTAAPWVWVKLWSGYHPIPALGMFLITAAGQAPRPSSWPPPAGRWWRTSSTAPYGKHVATAAAPPDLKQAKPNNSRPSQVWYHSLIVPPCFWLCQGGCHGDRGTRKPFFGREEKFTVCSS